MGIELGTKVRDKITGFSGVAMGKTEWLYGCVRIAVQSTELRDGKPVEPVWIDEPQLTEQPEATSGGPLPMAPNRDPRR